MSPLETVGLEDDKPDTVDNDYENDFVDSRTCAKCSAPAVTDDDGEPLCGPCFAELPEIDDCWAYDS